MIENLISHFIIRVFFLNHIFSWSCLKRYKSQINNFVALC